MRAGTPRGSHVSRVRGSVVVLFVGQLIRVLVRVGTRMSPFALTQSHPAAAVLLRVRTRWLRGSLVPVDTCPRPDLGTLLHRIFVLQKVFAAPPPPCPPIPC